MSIVYMTFTPGTLIYDTKKNILIEVIESNLKRNGTLVLVGLDVNKPVLKFTNFMNFYSERYIFLDYNLYANSEKMLKAIVDKKQKFPTYTFTKLKKLVIHKYSCFKTTMFDIGDDHYVFAYSAKYNLKNREE